MNKKIITIIIALAAVCGGASAQPKSTKCPRPLKTSRDFAKMTAVDTTQMRVYYAFCPHKIEDANTYIDLQRLDVGKRVVKYYSHFVYTNDSLVAIWWRQHPNSRTGAPWLGAIGRKDKEDIWSEYEWSDYFIEDGQLTEYCTMPRSLESYNSCYTEPMPKQSWTLHNETQTIIGYKCQRATCRFRGRDFEAWFAPAIPVMRGPWKFEGLRQGKAIFLRGCRAGITALSHHKVQLLQELPPFYPRKSVEAAKVIQRKLVQGCWLSSCHDGCSRQYGSGGGGINLYSL